MAMHASGGHPLGVFSSKVISYINKSLSCSFIFSLNSVVHIVQVHPAVLRVQPEMPPLTQ